MDMADDTPDENDVEAEMMRMMQEELSGDDTESEEDDALAEMAAAMAGGDDGGNIDEMLEQEMLKAMQSDTGDASGGGLGSLPAFGGAAAAAETSEGIERLADIDVNVTVELGGASVEIKDIMQWTSESIVELEAQESDLVDILVNGQLFARGEVVVVADTFGVRILELVNPSIEPSFRHG
ncbi:MAG: flagellar motor switch protein FliN/FliY [Candidatus Latescibacterota bacterium]|jgi:flagellar motor switch protein FliN/FliY